MSKNKENARSRAKKTAKAVQDQVHVTMQETKTLDSF